MKNAISSLFCTVAGFCVGTIGVFSAVIAVVGEGVVFSVGLTVTSSVTFGVIPIVSTGAYFTA